MKYTLKKNSHFVPGFGLIAREDFNEQHLDAMVQHVTNNGGNPETCLFGHLIEIGPKDQIVLPLVPKVIFTETYSESESKVNKVLGLDKLDKRSRAYKESQKALKNTEVGNYKQASN